MRNIYNLIVEINNFDFTAKNTETLFVAEEILESEKKMKPFLKAIRKINFSPSENSINKILSELVKNN